MNFYKNGMTALTYWGESLSIFRLKGIFMSDGSRNLVKRIPFEKDLKRVIRSRRSTDRHSNGQKKGDNQGRSLKANLGPALGLSTQVHTTTRCRFYREQLGPTPPVAGPANNDLQNIKQKTRYWATRTSRKALVISGAPEVFAVSAPHVTPVVLLLNDTNIIWYWNRVGHQYT